jgi:6-phosphofructokinase 1
VSTGGDAPGINAAIRAFIHAAHRRSVRVFGCRFGFEGLASNEGLVPMGLDDIRGILHHGGSMLGCSTQVYPFGRTNSPDRAEHDCALAIIAKLRSHEIDALVLIGGDGTLHAARELERLGIRCVVIPKTIDNDIGGTEVSFGFDTAVEACTRAIDALHSTAESHRRVMLVEVMGRNAGWIALASGIAGGADIVLIPEIPYQLPRVIAKIRERESLGLKFSIIVMGEGAHPHGGSASEVASSQSGNLPRLGGAAAQLAHALDSANIGHEVRLTVLGHVQRGGTPSAADRLLASRVGAHAAELCARGETGTLVSIRDGSVASVPIDVALAQRHIVEPNGEWVSVARTLGIELGAGAIA